MNLYELIRGRRHYVPEEKVKIFMRSLLRALDHMHRNGIFHRDVKPENLLLQEDTLKLADLGSCRGHESRMLCLEINTLEVWIRSCLVN